MAKTIQNQFKPDYYVPPGDILLETLEEIGMTQKDFATRTGITPKTVNGIVKGKAPISPETALQFEHVLGTPAHIWNNIESQYREGLAREKERQKLDNLQEWMSTIPWKDMIKNERLEDCRGDSMRQAQALLNFFAVSSPEAYRRVWTSVQVRYRMSDAVSVNQDAVSAWLRCGEIVARRIDCQPYDKAKFRDSLYKIREYTVAEPEVFQPAIQRLCADSGVALVYLEALPNTGISGATRWLTSDKALIQLSLRYKTNDHLWFGFFHEAAHILKHNKGNVYLEEKSGAIDNARVEEVEANNFAANLLIPPAAYRLFACVKSRDNILAFAKEVAVHPGIVVGRLQHERKIQFNQYNDLKEKFVVLRK